MELDLMNARSDTLSSLLKWDGTTSTLLSTPVVEAAGEPASGGVLELSYSAVALAAALIAVQALASVKFHLGLHTQLAIAAVRCVVQLGILGGYVLVPIFTYNKVWLVLLYCCFMVWVSALEAIGRPSKTFKGMFVNTLLIVGGSAAVTMSYALIVVMRVHPWWQPQYLIPILGMVLGNTITGVSVGLGTIIEELSAGADRVEKLLALGATRWEATRAPVSRAVRLAMTPLLNQMSVVGLVSIPGMMTGQILAGTDPSEAARYQMVIMFLLGAAATLGAVASIYAAVLHLVDGCHRLRSDRLIPKAKGAGAFAWMGQQLLAAGRWLWSTCCCCCCFVRKGSQDDGYQPLSGDDPDAGANHGQGNAAGGASARATQQRVGAALQQQGSSPSAPGAAREVFAAGPRSAAVGQSNGGRAKGASGDVEAPPVERSAR